jgi:thymidylate synthase (FAD)
MKNKRINVLDYGYVELLDYMSSDTDIAQAARVSTQKESKGVEADKQLIRYLMRHRHTSPFEMCEFKFCMKMPIFVARQLVRHRTASINEISGRYSILTNEFYTPTKERIKGKGTVNRQGSEGEVDDILKVTWLESLERHYSDEADLYEMANTFGISNELARINLPLAQYTEWVWKIDLHNLFHFLGLRMDSHAQWECQQYANAIYSLVKDIVPISCEAFEDYQFNSKTLSAQEWNMLRDIIYPDKMNYSAVEVAIPNKLERDEFYTKIGLI